MNNLRTILLILSGMLFTSCNTEERKKQKLTGINTLSYTDVVYIGVKDTVIVSTFSGRISKRINGMSEENVIIKIDDEIYSLAYAEKNNEIITSTMSSGILILDALTGVMKKKLSTGNSWINNIQLSDDGKYLMGFNGENKNFLWDVSKNYKPIKYPNNFPKSYVRFGKKGILYHSGKGKLVQWNPNTGEFNSQDVKGGVLKDISDDNKALFLNHNELTLISIKDTSDYVINKHPDWPLYSATQDTTYRIPYQMKLSEGRIARNMAFTGSIDRTVRIWDLHTGELKGEILKHTATISGMDISKGNNQMVSVDLKGGIHFHDLEY